MILTLSINTDPIKTEREELYPDKRYTADDQLNDTLEALENVKDMIISQRSAYGNFESTQRIRGPLNEYVGRYFLTMD